MGGHVLCDTGVISRFLTRVPDVVAKVADFGSESLCISVVTRTELLNWLSHYRTLDKKTRMELLRGIKSFTPLHINEDISKIYTEFSDADMVAKLADLLIGATASHHKMPLYTLNKKDFVKFGLTLV